MRHIDLTTPINVNGMMLAEKMVTVSSNNFGDQILEVKQLNKNVGYDVLFVDRRDEGQHMSDDQIKEWAKDVRSYHLKTN